MPGTRGKGIAAVFAIGVVSLGVYCVASWEDLLIRRHLSRLRSERGYLRELIEAPEDTPEGKALRVYLQEVPGQRALLETVLEAGLYPLDKRWRTDLQWIQKGLVGFDGEDVWYCIHSASSFPMMGSRSLLGLADTDPDPPTFRRSLYELLPLLEGVEVALPDHPRHRFSVLRGDAVPASLELTKLTSQGQGPPGAADHTCLILRQVTASLSELVAGLESPDDDTRLHAALDFLTAPELAAQALPELVAGLDDENWRGRGALISLLAGIGEPAREHLIRELDHPDLQMRLTVAEILLHIGGAEDHVIPVLIELLRRKDQRTRNVMAAIEYGQMDLRGFVPGDLLLEAGAKAVDPVRELLNDPDPFLRTFAAWAVGSLSLLGHDASAAVADLSACLRDSSAPWYLHAYAANALARLPPTNDAVLALMEAAEAEHVVVRRESVRALGEYGAAARSALRVLRRVRDGDRARRNREVAVEALAKIQRAR